MRRMVDDEKPRTRRSSRFLIDAAAMALVIGAFAVFIAPRMPYDQWVVSPYANTGGQNIALAESLAWRDGRLELEQDFKEDCEFEGRSYSVVGLAFTIMAVPITWMADSLGCDSHFPRPVFFLLMTMPVVFVAYAAVRGIVKSKLWAALLTIGFVCGTPLGPVIAVARMGDIYSMNHVIAVVGVFMIAADLLGRQRIWPAVIGLMLACWSRQMTCLYALPILLIAWRARTNRAIPDHAVQSGKSDAKNDGRSPSRRNVLPIFLALIGIGIAGALPLTLNYLKFGDPLESGYKYLYTDRIDPIAVRARTALFGIQYLPRHLHAMHLDYPHWDIRHGKLHIDLVEVEGGSLWLTTPLALGIFFTCRRWWRDVDRRILVFGTLPVIAGLHLYHTTGSLLGMYRYALDFLPVWWLVIAPFTESTPRAKRLTTLAIAYSILYYQVLYW